MDNDTRQIGKIALWLLNANDRKRLTKLYRRGFISRYELYCDAIRLVYFP